MNVAICPTKNRHRYLPLAILCFLRQTVPNKRLIILDNGPDSAEAVVNKAISKLEPLVPAMADIDYCRETLDSQKRPYIHGVAMNRCCSFAKPGDILFAWDDDDWCAPTRMESQLGTLGNYGLIGCDQLLFYQEDAQAGFHYIFGGPGYYAIGTSQCFTYQFWNINRFPELVMGADTAFCDRARAQKKLYSVAALGLIVARAHLTSTSPPNFRTTPQFQPYPLKNFPRQFWEDRKLIEDFYGGR